MALFYHPPKLSKKIPRFSVEIDRLDYQGLGVARSQGKVWFVENALPQEKVEVRVVDEKRQYGQAIAEKWLTSSPERQSPKCVYYQQCGGCQTQHIPIELQRSTKQQELFNRLQKLQAAPIEQMPMLVGSPWHYRRRLRLSLCFNSKSKQLDIGFRKKNQSQIVNIEHCEVIETELNQLLPELIQLLRGFSQPKLLGHVELIAADNGIAMLLRHQQQLADVDRALLQKFAAQHELMLFVQDDQQIVHLHGMMPEYHIDGFNLQFDIRDFIQINADLNQQMVSTALDWLDLQKEDYLLDLFCGMGNFTLPISRKVKQVVGIEGVAEMVLKAQKNAERNACNNVEFYQGNLEQSFLDSVCSQNSFNKVLLDPPRSGAAFAINALCHLQAEKVLYVSCNPATLVRDAAMLLNAGYQLKKVAMIDMFPQTGHLESISLFEK